MIVCDVSNPLTFQNVRKWLTELQRYIETDNTVTVVCNKIDQERKACGLHPSSFILLHSSFILHPSSFSSFIMIDQERKVPYPSSFTIILISLHPSVAFALH